MTITCWRAPVAALALVLSMLMGACSSLPPRVSQRPVAAIAGFRSTPLDAITRKILSADGQAYGRSGFQLLPYGPTSCAARIELAKLATRSLDVQYCLLAADNTGRALMRELRDAAQRGGRVRLLVDDLCTTGEDELLLALASYLNVQVRLFNPFPGGRGSDLTRFISSGLEFGCVTRRMYNKLFVADNVAAVAGGRNMADEFDHYWNSEVVYPVGHRQPRRRRAVAAAAGDGAHAQPAVRAGRGPAQPVAVGACAGAVRSADQDRGPRRTRELHQGLGDGGRDPVASHLAIEHQDGVAVHRAFGRRRRQAGTGAGRGIKVELVTNSLASTGEPWVYVGYWPHIHELLKSGVAIYELSPTLSVKRGKLGIFGHRTGALHMKNGIVDHKEVFLGSMNLDPRSARLNTEQGLIIESPQMARQLDGFADAGSAYRLRLDASGRDIEWVEDNKDGTQTAYDVPPETTAWQRLKLRLIAPFIPVSEL